MDVGILCPGPSLSGFLKTPVGHDLIIGVNRAATAYRCDWWVFGDPEAYREFTPIGSPRIGTLARSFEAIGPIEATVIDRLAIECPGEIRWQQFSLTAAMVLAQHLGAARIVVYGADWRGTLDWDGTAAPVRHKDRWASEAHRYEQVKTWLTRCNIRVVRVIGATNMAKRNKNGQQAAGNETMEEMLKDSVTPAAPPPELPVEAKKTTSGEISIVMRRRMMVGDRMREVGEKVATITMAPDVSIHWFCRAFMDGFCGD